MTIRIHEADGTPYEHIVEIKERKTRFEVPYNTKYKRLKRTRRQKERTLANAGGDYAAEGGDDVLLYSLGDVLQSADEVREWKITEWSAEDEESMSQESYEWIRMDADFEWICKMSLSMRPYMWVSQLQQDRDVVAQLEVKHFVLRAASRHTDTLIDNAISGRPKRPPTDLINLHTDPDGPAILLRHPHSCCKHLSHMCSRGARVDWPLPSREGFSEAILLRRLCHDSPK